MAASVAAPSSAFLSEMKHPLQVTLEGLCIPDTTSQAQNNQTIPQTHLPQARVGRVEFNIWGSLIHRLVVKKSTSHPRDPTSIISQIPIRTTLGQHHGFRKQSH